MNNQGSELDRHRALLAAYQQLLQQYPGQPRVYVDMAKLLLKLKSWEGVFEICEALFYIKPGHRQGLYLVGEAAALSGRRLDWGSQCLDEYLQKIPKPKEPAREWAFWLLGMIFEKQGEATKAKQQYENAIRLKPELKAHLSSEAGQAFLFVKSS